MRSLARSLHRQLAGRPESARLVHNIGWLSLEKVLRMGVGLIVGVWIARYLGPDNFGLLSFAMAFVGLFGAIAGVGLHSIVVRDLIRRPEVRNEILGTAMVLLGGGGIVAYALIMIFVSQLRPNDALAITLVAILGSAMLFKSADVALCWFESQVQSKYAVWAQNISFLLFASVKIAMILHSAPLVAFAWATMGEAALAAGLMLWALSAHGPALRTLRTTARSAQALLRESWPLVLSGLALMVQARIDQVMLCLLYTSPSPRD